MYVGGELDLLFLCDVEDNELPLGFAVEADSFGLNVAYEIPQAGDETQYGMTKTSVHS